MSAEINLLPCPFCGSEVVMLAEKLLPWFGPVTYRIECDGCRSGQIVGRSTEELSATAWNRRKLPPVKPQGVKGLFSAPVFRPFKREAQ